MTGKLLMKFLTRTNFLRVPGTRCLTHDTKKTKKRVVINIRGFNKITVTDFYFMLLQTNISFSIADCQFISVFDVTGFSHQWLVRVIDRYKFTVLSYRGQKQFNVAVMGFKKIPFYVRKKIDVILRVHRKKGHNRFQSYVGKTRFTFTFNFPIGINLSLNYF